MNFSEKTFVRVLDIFSVLIFLIIIYLNTYDVWGLEEK